LEEKGKTVTKEDKVSATLDYLTLSGRSAVIARLWSELGHLIDYYHSMGEKTHDLREFGYSGFRVGDLALFDNETNAYIRANNQASGVLFDLASGIDVRCTRIDLQATAIVEPLEVAGFTRPVHLSAADFVMASVEAARNDPSREKKPGKPSLFDTPKGVSVYVGSRAHYRFLRVYDKYRQSDGLYPQNSWRWEIELKQPASQTVYSQLRNITVGDRPRVIVDYIAHYCDERGIYHPFTGVSDSRLDDTQERSKSSVERKLSWIENQVQPSVRQLVELDSDRGGVDFTIALLKALGVVSSPIVAKHITEALRRIVHGG
jgi:hypothetical protein